MSAMIVACVAGAILEIRSGLVEFVRNVMVQLSTVQVGHQLVIFIHRAAKLVGKAVKVTKLAIWIT